jgi:hypothetical protein
LTNYEKYSIIILKLRERGEKRMKDLLINVLFLGSIALIFWGVFSFSEYQMRGSENFKGYTIEECQQYYSEYNSEYPENF